MYHRKAFGPQRRSSRQALARDIAASMLAAQQRGEHWPITFYTQQAETIRLVEEQLAAAVRDSKPAQEGAAAPLTDATQDCARGGDAMSFAHARRIVIEQHRVGERNGHGRTLYTFAWAWKAGLR